MNLEMPSPAEADSLRTILLIVLGAIILTIPVVCVIVVARVTAQRKQRLPQNKTDNRALHPAAGLKPMMMALPTPPGFLDSSHRGVPLHHTHLAHYCDRGGEQQHTLNHGDAEESAASPFGGQSAKSDSGSSSSGGGSSNSGGGSGGGGNVSD